MKAVGIAFKICSTIRFRGRQSQHEEHAQHRDSRGIAISRARCWLELPTVFDEVPFRHAAFLTTEDLMSSTTLARSRPASVNDHDPPAEVFAFHLVGARVAAGERRDVRDLFEVMPAIVGQPMCRWPRLATSSRYGSSSRTTIEARGLDHSACRPPPGGSTNWPTYARLTP